MGDITKDRESLLGFIFQSNSSLCHEFFLPYLRNQDLSKLDTSLTDKVIRNLYFTQIGHFYNTNEVGSISELNWIVNRNISITRFRLSTLETGKWIIIDYSYWHYLTFVYFPLFITDEDSNDELYHQLAVQNPDLIELSGGFITSAGLKAVAESCGHKLLAIYFTMNSDYPPSAETIEILCLNCPNLISFSLNGGVTDTNLVPLVQHCPRVEELSLGNSDISSNALPILSSLTCLKILSMTPMLRLSTAAAISMLKCFSVLETLHLTSLLGDDSAASDLLTCLGSHCPKLFDLRLGDLNRYSDESFLSLVRGCPRLEILDITIRNDASLIALGRYSPHLKTLVPRSNGYSDIGLIALSEGCPDTVVDMRILSMREHVTDRGVLAIARHCSKLDMVHAYLNSNISKDSLCILFKSTPLLTNFMILDCALICDECITTLFQYCHNITKFTLNNASENGLISQQSFYVSIRYMGALEQLTLTDVDITDETLIAISRQCTKLTLVRYVYGICILYVIYILYV